MFRYNFALDSIPNYTLYGLEQEVIAARGPLVRTRQVDNTVSLFFDQPLDQAAEDKLLATCLAHKPDLWKTRISALTILPLADEFTPPLDLDFSVGLTKSLQKINVNVWQGDILQTRYYDRIDDHGLPQDPVVQWDTRIVYNNTSVDAYETISWVLKNGQLHPTTKNLHQTYIGQRWLDWLEGKRGQIIAWLRWNVAAAMIYNLVKHGDGTWDIAAVMAEGARFFRQHGQEIATYISGNDRTVLASIGLDPRLWLNGPWPQTPTMTIRQKFQEQMAY
jgi:hypothetical protein